jgi:hypothetical protein
MPSFYGAIDLGKNELRNAVIQNLGTAPATPSKGQIYFNSADNTLYWWDGTQWVAAKSAGSLSPASTVTTQAVGDSPVVGASTNYAREDHKHGRESFGAIIAETSFGGSSTNGSAFTIARSDHAHGNPVHNAAAHSTIPLNSFAMPTGSVDFGNQNGINLLSPVNGQDAVNKNYVDNISTGIAWKNPCRLATTANITLSASQFIDGVSAVAGDRVLVKNQTTATQNGIYVCAAGAWTRATDADAGTELVSAAAMISEGSTQADTSWVCTTNAPITIGSTNITFVQFGGGATYTAGAGLTQTGNTFDVVAGDTSLTVAADSIIVNTAVIATVASVASKTSKYASTLTGTTSPETVTHNLNTRDIQVTVYNGSSPYTAVEVDWDAATVNTVTIRYNPNLGAGYRVVVVG